MEKVTPQQVSVSLGDLNKKSGMTCIQNIDGIQEAQTLFVLEDPVDINLGYWNTVHRKTSEIIRKEGRTPPGSSGPTVQLHICQLQSVLTWIREAASKEVKERYLQTTSSRLNEYNILLSVCLFI
jgi:hypothetical protein